MVQVEELGYSIRNTFSGEEIDEYAFVIKKFFEYYILKGRYVFPHGIQGLITSTQVYLFIVNFYFHFTWDYDAEEDD